MPLLGSARELSLLGVKLADLAVMPDERGFFAEIFRKDWLLFEDEIVQANLSFTYPGMVRAWHRHLRGQVDYFLVVVGSIKVCAYDDETKQLVEVILSDRRPQILRVPGHYWHGFKVVGNGSAIHVYFVNKLYNYTNPDEERRPWNDPAVVPLAINGRKDDPRCGKPWDWFYPPHR
ncbi:MAG: dTDP-4-dehydrorhamnose 3,5-epimerase family protein [Thermofilaceae archaeon]